MHARATATPGRTPRLNVWVRALVALVALGLVGWFVVVPEFRSSSTEFGALGQVAPGFVIAAILLQAASLASYSALTLTVLGPGMLRYRTVLRIDLADLAVNHVVPGGGATAATVRFGLLVADDVPPARALGTAAVEIVVSNLVLGAIFAFGLTLTLATTLRNAWYGVAAIAVVLLAVASVVIGRMLLHDPDTAVRRAGRLADHIPLLGRSRAEQFVQRLALTLSQLVDDRARLVRALLFAASNWIFDVASLWLMLLAFGGAPSLGAILAVYGVGSILAMLPFTPGGLGLVEGVMVPAFVAFGVPGAAALLGVLSWRVVEFWLPIPIGGAAYASLRIGASRRRRRRDAAAT